MSKDRFHRILEREALFSGPANIIRQEIGLLDTYHAIETLQEIEAHIKQFRENERPLRSVLIVSDPLHFDELGYFRYQFNKPNSFMPQEFNYMRRWKDAKTALTLSLTYNRGFPHTIDEEGQRRETKDNEDKVVIVAFPGAGVLVEHEQVRAGVESSGLRHALPYQNLRQDPDLLPDALWDVIWKNPPLGKIKKNSVLQ